MKRLLALLLTLCLMTGLTAVTAYSEAGEEGAYDEVFVVVHTNDVHGFIDVEPYVKAVADEMKVRYGEKNVVTVSAGDVFSGGNAVAHLYNGETIPPIMNAAGYDFLSPGNNDFMLGNDQLLALAGMFEHTKVLCANLFWPALDENGEPVTDEEGNPLPGDTVFDRTASVETGGGVKIGLFGLTVNLGSMNSDFSSLGTIDGAREAVELLRDEGCSVIVGVGHTGWNDDLKTPSANDVTSAEMVKEVPGIDAYIDGHSHSIIGGGSGWVCPETGTLVNQASCKGACVGVIRLYIKDGAVTGKQAELLTQEELTARYTPDPAVQALVDAAWGRLAEDMGEMYTETAYFLNGLRASESPDGRSIRADETNLGDLVADFMRWYAQADVAFAPGFAIRCSIDAGEIYTLNLYDVFAIGCDVYVYEVTGEELLEMMAASLSALPFESPAFNQISGASYGYLTEYALSEEEEKIYTIVEPLVNGEPLELEKTYLLAAVMNNSEQDDLEPVLSSMEEAAAAMGEYLKSGEAAILPDVPIPDHRIVPMEELPDGAVTYPVLLESENKE